MPLQPSRSDLHVNRPLTTFSVATIQSEDSFIADQAFPRVPVQKQSDRYTVYTPDYWTRTIAAKRAPASESVGGGWRVDNTPTYFADKWAVHHDIPEEDYANADDAASVDMDAAAWVTRQLLLRREKQFISQYMTAGIWKGYSFTPGTPVDFLPNTHGTGYWDSGSSNPLADVDVIRAGIEAATGFMPNVMIVTRNVFYALRNNALVLDRIKYTQRGIVSEDLLASLFGVDKFLVAGAVQNTAQEGQTAVTGFMASNMFWLGYAPTAPSLRTPSAGYIFTWNGLLGAGAYGNRIKKFPMVELEAERVEGEMAFAMQVIAPGLGALGTNVLLHP